mgnify:FL=1
MKWKDAKMEKTSLHGADLSWAEGEGTNFGGADFTECDLEHDRFRGCSFRSADFRKASLYAADFRGCDLTGADLRGADVRMAILSEAILTGVRTDDATLGWKMHCPEQGAFLAYKKCVYDRIVQLLIPADARRSSATAPTCRCDKAKVLTIKNFDETKEFDEAWSLVDENFVYRKGQWVYADSFDEDRWKDSTHGIHFWMTREEAMEY